MSMKADLELPIRLKPKNVRTCYVCGPDNARGLQVAFLADGAHGSRALYTARQEHEGWPGLLHGGVTFSLRRKGLEARCDVVDFPREGQQTTNYQTFREAAAIVNSQAMKYLAIALVGGKKRSARLLDILHYSDDC
jgi:hypothetical protein